MLREVHIKNVAVIESAAVQFDNGFQTLTGETGAGKSILIDSISMALGSRSSRELIRTGAEFASVDLVFETDNKVILNKLNDLGIECEDSTILIGRKIFADGKSKCMINGRLTPLNIVKEAGELLLTIHGQNDNQSLLSPKSHIHFVDEYAENTELLLSYKEQYKKVKETEEALALLNTDDAEKERLTELLSFQVDEINSAKLKAGEEEELEEKRSFLQNAEEIADAANGAYFSLHGDESDSGACDMVVDALKRIERVKDFDSKLAGFYETLSSVMADVDDVMHELCGYKDSIDYSSRELDETEERLSLIFNLKRKYGNSIEEILEYAEKSAERLSAIQKSDERRAELEDILKKERLELLSRAEKLTKSRLDASLKLQESVMNELLDLDMHKMRFSVSISPKANCEKDGIDDVEFLISANPGEELKPLSKIASGGEMSRIMLAMKSVLSDSDMVETLIFDEIDTGVSGRAAQKIAEKMGMLSKKRQLLCITHLAQIAAMADYHYLIEKSSDADITKTTVTQIDGDERICELARIIGGVKVTDTTLNAAQEMLDMAAEFKK